MKALLVPVTGRTSLVDVKTGDGLADMRRVLGGWAELVVRWRTPDEPWFWLWCDEEGAVKGLLPNRTASRIAGRLIVGPALLTGPAEGADVPDELRVLFG